MELPDWRTSWRMLRQGRVKEFITTGLLPCLADTRNSLMTVLSLISQQESFCLTRADRRLMSCLMGARVRSPLVRAPESRL